MRTFTVTTFLLVISYSIIFAQAPNYLNEELESAKKREISGIVFTSASLAFATLGTILMVSNSDHTYSRSENGRTEVGFTSAGGGIGLMITLPAPPLLIVGIVKWVRGAKGKKYYTTF